MKARNQNSKFSLKYFSLYLFLFSIFPGFYLSQVSSFTFPANPTLKYALLNSFVAISISILMISLSLATFPSKLILALFWLFNLIFFGLAQYSYICDPNPYFLSRIAPAKYVFQASMIILIGLIVSALAQIFYLQRMNQNEPNTMTYDPRELLKRAKFLFWMYFLFLIPISQLIGGFSMMFRTVRIVSNFNQFSLPTYSIGFAFCYGLPLVNAIVFLLISKFRINKSQKIYTYIIVCWCVLISNPLGIARQTTLFLILPFIFILLKGNNKLSVYLFLFLTGIIIYQPVSINRFSGDIMFNRFLPLSQNGDFDSFAQVSNGLYSLDKGNFPLFKQVLGSIFFPIPRSVWPNKPLDTGVVVAQSNGLSFQNLSAPWPLEMYVNGRLPFLIICCILIIRYLYKRDFHDGLINPQNVNIAILFGLLFILMRGSLLQATGITLFSLFICRLHFLGVPKSKNLP